MKNILYSKNNNSIYSQHYKLAILIKLDITRMPSVLKTAKKLNYNFKVLEFVFIADYPLSGDGGRPPRVVGGGGRGVTHQEWFQRFLK